LLPEEKLDWHCIGQMEHAYKAGALAVWERFDRLFAHVRKDYDNA
jgi:hypothetical protein